MAALSYPRSRTPPALYRVSQLLRRLAIVVLVVIVLFLATVAYSAVRLVDSSPQTGGYAASFASNDTVAITGSVVLSNPGYYPVAGFTLGLRVLNNSGGFLGTLKAGPVTLAAGSSTTFPIALYLPISAGSPAESLLVTDQELTVGFWGNTTYAYLFPISVHFTQTKSWGAPFADLKVTAGAPTLIGGTVFVPVTISFTNDASFAEVGSLNVQVVQANGFVCGGGSFPLNVAPGDLYDQTQNVDVSSGCSTAGGYVASEFVSGGTIIPLPPEALP
jgi:hypothetical protein